MSDCLTCIEHGRPYDGPCPHCGASAFSLPTPAPEAVAGLEARAREMLASEMELDVQPKDARPTMIRSLPESDLSQGQKWAIRAIAAALAQQPTREDVLRLVRGCNKRHGMYGYREQDCEEAADAILALIGRAS